jgi:hypothetical protein
MDSRQSVTISRDTAGRSSPASQPRPGPVQQLPVRSYPKSAATAWIRFRSWVPRRTRLARWRSSGSLDLDHAAVTEAVTGQLPHLLAQPRDHS